MTCETNRCTIYACICKFDAVRCNRHRNRCRRCCCCHLKCSSVATKQVCKFFCKSTLISSNKCHGGKKNAALKQPKTNKPGQLFATINNKLVRMRCICVCASMFIYSHTYYAVRLRNIFSDFELHLERFGFHQSFFFFVFFGFFCVYIALKLDCWAERINQANEVDLDIRL